MFNAFADNISHIAWSNSSVAAVIVVDFLLRDNALGDFMKQSPWAPIGSSEAERSFSVLRRLKNHLRSTMSEERLAGLTMMAVHYPEASGLSSEQLIERFIKQHPRKLFCQSILFDWKKSLIKNQQIMFSFNTSVSREIHIIDFWYTCIKYMK